METMELYLKMIRISLRGKMEYRADFWTGMISVIVSNAVTLSLIGIMIQRFHDLNGWTLWDLVFLYNLFLLGHSINSVLFWHIRMIDTYIIQGTFDQFLIRPLSPLIQLLGREIHYMGVGDVLVGIAGVTLSYLNLGLHWNFGEWLFFFAAIISGTLIELALCLMVACIAFWTGRMASAFSVFWQFNLLIQQYPISIFGNWFRVVVTGFIPVAFINYYPSLVLLGKTAQHNGVNGLAYGSPFVAVILIGLSSLVWRFSIKHYSSTGS